MRALIRAAACTLLALAAVFEIAACAPRAVATTSRVFIGTYTTGESRGIYSAEFDSETGRFRSDPQLAVETTNPSFLALHPDGRTLYAVNELQQFQGAATGAVSAFGIDRDSGRLTLLNQQPSEGADPCFVLIDPAGRHVLVANYTGGTVAVLPIAANGGLEPAVSVRRRAGHGPVAARQDAPHAHHIAFDPSGRFVFWTDLGTDRVVIDQFDTASGKLEPSVMDGVSMQPGSGPRHIVWHRSGHALYVLNELSATVTAVRFSAPNGLIEIVGTVSARADGASGANTAAEIVASDDSRFLYTSNRGDDNIMVFAIDPKTMLPAAIGQSASGGKTPRHFTFDPSGHWMLVANQESNSIVVMRVDRSTGLLTATSEQRTVPSPVHLLFR